MWIYLPLTMGAPLTEEQEKEVQQAATESWLLYGELHVTNAPRGVGVTLLDPKRVTYQSEADEAAMIPSPFPSSHPSDIERAVREVETAADKHSWRHHSAALIREAEARADELEALRAEFLRLR